MRTGTKFIKGKDFKEFAALLSNYYPGGKVIIVAQDKDEKHALSLSEEETENMTPAPKVLLISLVLLLAAYGIWHSLSEDEETPVVVAAEQVEPITIVEQSYPLPVQAEETKTALDSETPTDMTTESVVPPVPPVKPEYRETPEDLNESFASDQQMSAAAVVSPAVEQQPVQTVPLVWFWSRLKKRGWKLPARTKLFFPAC